ncbi:hypothetical protein OROHE_022753 [Orobanche hederae]
MGLSPSCAGNAARHWPSGETGEHTRRIVVGFGTAFVVRTLSTRGRLRITRELSDMATDRAYNNGGSDHEEVDEHVSEAFGHGHGSSI